MSYEIKLDNYTFTESTKPRAKTYLENVSNQIGLKILLIIVSFLIIANSIYPVCVKDFMESIGIIKYVEFERAHYYENHIGRHSNRYIGGNYTDHNNQQHRVHISYTLPQIDFSFNDINIREGAYYTFLPSYDLLRGTSCLSITLLYSIFIFCLYKLIKINKSLKKSMTNFYHGKLIKPISFGYEHVTDKKSKVTVEYKFYVLWDTPIGEFYESDSKHNAKVIKQSLSFESEYCGLFLQQADGDFIIVRPEAVEEVIKKYHYKIDRKNLTVTVDNTSY